MTTYTFKITNNATEQAEIIVRITAFNLEQAMEELPAQLKALIGQNVKDIF